MSHIVDKEIAANIYMNTSLKFFWEDLKNMMQWNASERTYIFSKRFQISLHKYIVTHSFTV
jgi:hypothetical protein